MTAVTDVHAPRRDAGERLPRWWPEAVASAVIGLPFVAAVARAFRGAGRLGGDLALTELAVRAVGTHAVLVGPYSRFGWNYPGPLYFYVLAPFYWLFGADGRAITVGAILIGLASACSILIFARRRGGSGLVLWSAIILGLLLWHLDEAAWSSWTPYATVLPAAAFLMAAWSVACVDRWALPVAAVTGSFVIQTYLAYIPLVAAVGGAALIVCVMRMLRGAQAFRAWRLPVALAAGLFVLVWTPPTIDAFVHDPSNLDQLRAFQEDYIAQETYTAGDGWQATTHGLSGFLEGRADTSDQDVAGRGASWASVIAVGAVAAAGLLAARRRRWDALVLIGLLLVASAASVYAVSQVVDELHSHIVLWTCVLSFMAWFSVGAAVVPELEHSRVVRRMTVGAAVAGGVAVAILVWPGGTSADTGDPRVSTLISRVERRVPDGRPVVVRLGGGGEWEWATALVAGLRQDGFNVHGERQPGAMEIVFEPRDLTDVQRGDAVVTLVGAPGDCGTAELCVPVSLWAAPDRRT